MQAKVVPFDSVMVYENALQPRPSAGPLEIELLPQPLRGAQASVGSRSLVLLVAQPLLG